ncbi:major facilitator superfamily domain-containing protein [Zopfochytrium polystomum]|nr:major facilitator superfamily domain-containing protein [Zopfochytrium polystomum]
MLQVILAEQKLLGPVVGPVAGGLIAQYVGWRWMFVLLAVVGAAVWLAIFFFLPETLRSRTGNGTRPSPHQQQPGAKKPGFNPLAPLAFLAVPAIAICVAAVAAIFGTFYPVTVEVPAAFSALYGFSSLAVGLAYLGLGLGFVAGSLAGGRAADRLLAAEMKRLGTANAKDVPTEIRVRSAAIGIVVFPVGVLLFGISLEFAWHPAAVIACMFVLAFGMTWTFSCTTTYLVDSYPGTAAGIVALNSLFRNPAAAAGSAVIAPLIAAARPAASFAVFASAVVVAGVALVPVVVYGPRWREEYRKKNDKSETATAPVH